MVTGRRECGRTTTLATIMAEIGRVYEPGASIAEPTSRPSAQVWLVDPRRQLLTTLGHRLRREVRLQPRRRRSDDERAG